MECTYCRKWHFQGLLSCPTAPKTPVVPKGDQSKGVVEIQQTG